MTWFVDKLGPRPADISNAAQGAARPNGAAPAAAQRAPQAKQQTPPPRAAAPAPKEKEQPKKKKGWF